MLLVGKIGWMEKEGEGRMKIRIWEDETDRGGKSGEDEKEKKAMEER